MDLIAKIFVDILVDFAKELPGATAKVFRKRILIVVLSRFLKAQAIIRDLSGDMVDAPEWVVFAKRLHDQRQWGKLNDYGFDLVKDGIPMDSFFHGRLAIWVGEALFHLGDYDTARKLFKCVLARCRDLRNRIDALTNLSSVYSVSGKFGKAKECIERALGINPNYGPALVNRLCYASKDKNKADCKKYSRRLANSMPEANDLRSVIGKALKTDPDLKYFRTLKVYRDLFPRLQETEPLNRKRSFALAGATVAVAIFFYFVLVANAHGVITVGAAPSDVITVGQEVSGVLASGSSNLDVITVG